MRLPRHRSRHHLDRNVDELPLEVILPRSPHLTFCYVYQEIDEALQFFPQELTVRGVKRLPSQQVQLLPKYGEKQTSTFQSAESNSDLLQMTRFAPWPD